MSMYSARVPDAVEEDIFAAAEFDALRRDENDAEDDDESWDIAAFSRISIVTSGGAADNDDTNDFNFQADFPDEFGFPIPPTEVEETKVQVFEEEPETVVKEEEPKEEESMEEIPIVEEEEKDEEHKDVDPEAVVDDEPEAVVNEEPEPVVDEEPEAVVEVESARSTSPATEGRSPPGASVSREPLDAFAHMILMTSLSEGSCTESQTASESKGECDDTTTPAQEETPMNTTAISDASDVWTNVVNAVKSASTAATGVATDIASAMEEPPPPRTAGAPPPAVASSADSVPSVTSSSDSSSDDEDDEHPIKKTLSNLSHGTSGSKSASSRILNFFGKRHRRSGSKGSSVKSADKTKFINVSPKNSSKSKSSKDKTFNSKDKTVTSKDKNMKIKLHKGAPIRNKDKCDPPPAKKNYESIHISDEDNVVDTTPVASPERQSRVYKIVSYPCCKWRRVCLTYRSDCSLVVILSFLNR